MTARQLFVFLAGTILPSFLLSLVATGILRRLAPTFGLIDRPGARKVHATPTPLGGGIAIWLGIVAPILVGFAVASLVQRGALPTALLPELAARHLTGVMQQSAKLLTLFAASGALLVLGLADDLKGIAWYLRLGMQAIVAGLCVLLVDDLQLTLFVDVPLLTGALSIVWIVGLINSFNMLDNMDGLSAGVATIAAAMLATILLLAPDPETRQPQLFVAGLLLVVVGSSLGFLWHNRPPASIFMGDAGSYVLGFLLAVASLLATYTSYRGSVPHAVLAPLCVLAVPLYDMVTVIAIRLAIGHSPFHADKNHFSHRLVELGLSKAQAVLTIYLTTATCGLGGLLLHQVDFSGAVVVVLLVLCVLALIAIIETTARRTVQSRDRNGNAP